MPETPVENRLRHVESEIAEMRVELRNMWTSIDRLIEYHEGTASAEGLRTRVSALEDFRKRVKWTLSAIFTGVVALAVATVQRLISGK